MNVATRSSTSGVSVTVIEPVACDDTTLPYCDSIAWIDACRLLNAESDCLTRLLPVLLPDTPGVEPLCPLPVAAPEPVAPPSFMLSLVAPLWTFAFNDASPGIAFTWNVRV